MKILAAMALTLFFTSITALADGPTPVSLTPTGFGNARQPQVAVAPSGTVYVVFGKEKSIFITSSSDHGATFSAPVKIADCAKMPLGMRRGPRVAASDKRIVVTAPNTELVSFISDDGGKTWSQAVRVNDKSGSAMEGLQNLTALPDGGFYAVWLDSRGGSSQIEGARLDSGANEWGKNVTVYKSAEKTVCECCHPSIISDAKGKLTAMWRNVVKGNRDFYLAESTDRGDTFAAATELGEGHWPLNACPMDGGNLVATPDGVVTIWRRMTDVYVARAGEPEKKIAGGAQPVIAAIGGQIYDVFQDRTNLAVTKDGAAVATFAGAFPAIIASPDGKEGYLVFDHTEAGVGVPQLAVIR